MLHLLKTFNVTDRFIFPQFNIFYIFIIRFNFHILFISTCLKFKYSILTSFKGVSCNFSTAIFWCTSVCHRCRHKLYLNCTCYNCLPEDERLGSKYVHVEDIVKIKIKLVLKMCVLLAYITWLYYKARCKINVGKSLVSWHSLLRNLTTLLNTFLLWYAQLCTR